MIALSAVGVGMAMAGAGPSTIAQAQSASSANRGSAPTFPTVGSGPNVLTGVAATSASSVWAVGYYSNGTNNQQLIEFYNGTGWSVVPAPNPGGTGLDIRLFGVAADSSNDVWAVGHYSTTCGPKTLIEHYNGTAWSVVPSPNPTGCTNDYLNAVAVDSPSDAWAVGRYQSGGVTYPLVEHWNGSAWSMVSSPFPGGNTRLNGVAAAGATDVWVVGYYKATKEMTILEHFNGTSWQVAPSIVGDVDGVTAVPGGGAVAVGECGGCQNTAGTDGGSLVEQWTSNGWQIQPSPDTGCCSWALPLSVAAVSASDMWAVGNYPDHQMSPTGPQYLLIDHWDGTKWSVVANTITPGVNTSLTGVAAASANDVWAVGSYINSNGVLSPLIEHYDGTSWQQTPTIPDVITFEGKFDGGAEPWKAQGGSVQCAPQIGNTGGIYRGTLTKPVTWQGRLAGLFDDTVDSKPTTFPLEDCAMFDGTFDRGVYGVQFFGESFWVPSSGLSIVNQSGSVSIAALHASPSVPQPPVSLVLSDNSLNLQVDTGSYNSTTGQYQYQSTPVVIPAGGLTPGAWNDVILAVNWQADSTGYINSYYRAAGGAWHSGGSVTGQPTVSWAGSSAPDAAGFYDDLPENSGAFLTSDFPLYFTGGYIGKTLAAVEAELP